MIENESQMDIALMARNKFFTALADLLRQKPRGAFWDIQREAIESMIAEFDEDIAGYLARQSVK
jgi:hypothetical protein